MVPYGGSDSDDELFVSGELDEYNDPDTSSEDLGSGPALGGDETELSTYDSLGDDDVTNFTGQSSTALVATDEPVGVSVNPSGGGSAPQQIATQVPDQDLTDDFSAVSSPGTGGAVLAQTFNAPTATQQAAATNPALTQTSQHGLSTGAQMVLFFILGSLLGLFFVTWLEERD
jgi:hypothetical protein